MLQTYWIRGFQIRVSILSTFLLFYTFVSSTFYSKSSHLVIPHKCFEKDGQLLGSICTCFEHSEFGLSELGFRFYSLFYRVKNSVSSTFYSKASCLIIPKKKFAKDGQILNFISTCFKYPKFGVSELGFRFYSNFYYDKNSISSTFYSRSSYLIIPHNSFAKDGQ